MKEGQLARTNSAFTAELLQSLCEEELDSGIDSLSAMPLATGVLEMPMEGKSSVGRWTDEEQATFLRGLEIHGKNWKSISAMVCCARHFGPYVDSRF